MKSKSRTHTTWIVPLLGLLIPTIMAAPAVGQQIANSDFVAEVANPAFESGAGPVVVIDEAHNNFHTKDGRYAPFAAVLAADGFQVNAGKTAISPDSLESVGVLVIANALHGDNASQWKLPTPSAFTNDEIDAIDEWVSAGGSLFLIADHMPFPGAAAELADRFGVRMINGFAFELQPERPDEIIRGPVVFKRDNEAISSHAITEGRDESERIEQVASFTGQVFEVPESSSPILSLMRPSVIMSPEVAWQFNETTEKRDAQGLAQGVAIEHGTGRVVIFGEAAMFTSQRSGNRTQSNGMTAEIAQDNQQLLLNVMRWLAKEIDN